ncbi:hypothetical protein AAKU64_004500 [Undibacterium sp. GrIS 1.8]
MGIFGQGEFLLFSLVQQSIIETDLEPDEIDTNNRINLHKNDDFPNR